MSEPASDMWDALAESVPEPRRIAYWKAVARIRQLRPDDEILILIEAMGLLASVTAEIPKRLAADRSAWTAQIAQIRFTLEQLARDISSQAVTVGNTLDKAASSLASTARIVEINAATVRNGLNLAPSLIHSRNVAEAVSRELETRLVQPAEKSVETMVAIVNKLPVLVNQAERSLEFLKAFDAVWHYVVSIIIALVVGSAVVFLLWKIL